MSVQQSRTRAEDVDEATQELFKMADSIRDDGYYDVEITGWEKDGDQVEVTYQTPIDGTHSNTYQWPSKPTESNQFVQILMAALEVDDPVAAVSRADALKPPDGDELGDATVPCNADSGWNLKPSVASTHSDSDDEQIGRRLSTVLKAGAFVLGPIAFAIGTIGNYWNEPGTWWPEDKSAADMFTFVQGMWYALWGSVVWLTVAILLL